MEKLYTLEDIEAERERRRVNDILARQDLNRQLRYNSNARIWAKQAELGRKGK